MENFYLSNKSANKKGLLLFDRILFSIIKIIGPISNPIIPIILKPVYIAIKVNIGCIPIL